MTLDESLRIARADAAVVEKCGGTYQPRAVVALLDSIERAAAQSQRSGLNRRPRGYKRMRRIATHWYGWGCTLAPPCHNREESMPDETRTANERPTRAVYPTKTCPTCDGEKSWYDSGPSWGYWGGQDVEYRECPTCDGTGTVYDDEVEA